MVKNNVTVLTVGWMQCVVIKGGVCRLRGIVGVGVVEVVGSARDGSIIIDF